MRKAPLLLEDFNGERRWGASCERCVARAALVPFERGNALRLDYDFRPDTTESGSRRAYCHTFSGAGDHLALRRELAELADTLVIPEGEYPSHLGLWIYGDGSCAWSNGCVVDANGVSEEIAYGDQEKQGWYFVAGAIPPGLTLPIYVSYPLRLLSGSRSIHGSVWVGQVLALYDGIDFDALAPVAEEIRWDGGAVTALLRDPADTENHCAASGVDPARTEVYIDGQRQTRVSLAAQADGVALRCVPEEALCEGWHKAEIVVYDRGGNVGRGTAFFRLGEGIAWEMPETLGFGNTVELRVTGVDAQAGALHLDWECEGPLSAAGEGRLQAGFDLAGPTTAVLRCREGYYLKDGAKLRFCLPDLQVRLEARLRLVMRGFCQGFDAEFLVRDLQGRPVQGAVLFCNGRRLEGRTGEDGVLRYPGLTEGALGEKITAYACWGEDYSETCKVNLSRDFARRRPEHITLTLRGAGEVGVTWQCGAEVREGFAEYGRAGAQPVRLAAVNAPQFTVMDGAYTELSAFRAVLAGLQPGERYRYRVGGPAGWSDWYSFRVPGEGEITFAALADTHNRCGEAMASARRRCPDLDFFLHAGDYVGSGSAYGDWLALHRDAGGLAEESLMLPVVGNHDTMDGDGAHYRMMFASPGNGSPGAREGMNYFCELGHALFVALGENECEDSVRQWLGELTARSTAPWRILFLHSGPYTCYLSTDEYERHMSGLAETFGFQLVLSGHDHVYHRGTILDGRTLPVGEAVRAGEGVTYVQCGSSGGGRAAPSCEEEHRPIWNKIYDSTKAMYSLVSVSRERICLTGVEVGSEKVFDTFTIYNEN